MANYLKPRRGKKATAINQNIILQKGEIFLEMPDTGVGTGAGKIKIGDGITGYADLPYFNEGSTVNQSQIDAINIALNSKADSSHDHDDRYYTESEIDIKLDTKQNSSTAINTSNIASQSVSNADTVDGYHITSGTTELTDGTSTLATNTIYICYE